jgi:hypothetical protein
MNEELTKSVGVSINGDGDRQVRPSVKLGRRALMLGAATGMGAAVALVVGAQPAGADDTPVLLGESNSETGTTTISNATSGAFTGNTSANGGHSGLHGNDTSTDGGYGVAGNSINGDGVNGTTSANGKAGVYGNDGSPDGAYGVYGFSRVGTGVYGIGTSGATGVFGQATIAVGVQGTSESGTGVLATSPVGTALEVEGVATFSRSGLVSIAAADKTATVTGVGLSASSLVFANLQDSLPGVFVEAVVRDISGSSFEIYLSKAVPAGKTAKVAWFVVN